MENAATQREWPRELDRPWQLVSNPDVLPGPAVSTSLTVRARTSVSPAAMFPGIPLPEDLVRAAHSRQVQYLAGRFCASRALAALGVGSGPCRLERTAVGTPAWPADVVGSITHTGEFVWAAVAWTHDVRGIGIDSERLMPADSVRRVRSIVASADEMAAARDRAHADDALAVALVFSIKESLFKCLYPLVGRRFGYSDACVTDLDTTAGRFRVRLAMPLGPFAQGAEWDGRLQISAARVHTGLVLPARLPEDPGEPG